MTDALTVRGLVLDGVSLSPRAVAAAARQGDADVRLSEAAGERMRAALPLKWSLIEEGIPVYGVTTGFGDSCIRQISADKAHELQRNLVVYHLNGTGPAAPAEVARATMMIRANSVSRGTSAIRPEVAGTLLEHMRRGILPLIREVSPFVDRDRRLDRDVNAVIELIETGALRRAVGLSDEDFCAGRDLAGLAG